MDENRARLLAQEYRAIEQRTPLGQQRDGEYHGRHWDELTYALTLQLSAAVPDAAVAVAVKRLALDPNGEATPIVAATDGQALYIVACVGLSPSSGPNSPVATIEARRIPIDPRAGSVSVATTFNASRTGRPLHKNRWTFEIGGESLSIESERVSDSRGDDVDVFARALANALGYELPDPAAIPA